MKTLFLTFLSLVSAALVVQAQNNSSNAANASNAAQAQQNRVLRPRNVSKTNNGRVKDIALSPDGTLIANASGRGVIQLRSAENGRLVKVFQGLRGQSINSLTFSSDNKQIISVGDDSVVRMWDVTTGDEVKKLQGHEHGINAITSNPTRNKLFTAGQGTRIMVWDKPTNKLEKIFSDPVRGHIDTVNTLAFSFDGKYMASGGDDSRIVIWDARKGKVVKTLLGHADSVNTLAFVHQSNQFLVSGSSDTTVKVWDLSKGRQIKTLDAHTAPVTSLAFSPDGYTLVTGSADGSTLAWSLPHFNFKTEYPNTGPVEKLLFLSNDRFVVGDKGGVITEWDLDNTTQL